jgi:hypothetical protein
MAGGASLTERQRKLWRRALRPGGLQAMDAGELHEWLRVCDVMADDSDAHGASKARRTWNGKRREAEAELARREAG